MKPYRLAECYECCKMIYPIEQQSVKVDGEERHYCGSCNLKRIYAPTRLKRN